MVALPEALLDEFKRGNALLFVGERIIEDATGQVFVDQLTRQLAQRAEMAPSENCTFSEAAQAYADKAGYHALVSFVRDRFDELGDAPQAIHCLIAGLQKCTVLVTTCLDCKLEKAFETAGRPLDVVSGNVDLAFEDTRKTQLYKLRGSLDRTDTLVLTEDQYENFFYDRESCSGVARLSCAQNSSLYRL